VGTGTNLNSLSKALELASTFWFDKRQWKSWFVLLVVVAMALCLVGTAILATYWQRALFNSLEAKDWDAFVALLFTWHSHPQDGLTIGFTPLLIVNVVCTVYGLYLKQLLQIRWRTDMTASLQQRWMQDRIYYRIHLQDNQEDNPDQRIAEDVDLFIEKSLTLGLGLLETSVSMISFVVLLWVLSRDVSFFGHTYPGSLVVIALVYAGIGTIATHWIGKRLLRLNFTQQKAEANFRFQLVRFRENVESIAFYRGEKQERQLLSELFSVLRANWDAIMDATKRVMLFSTSFSQATLVFPLVIAAPAYFAGSIPLGGVFQTANALNKVIENLSWFVEHYLELATFGATIERLSRFSSLIQRTGNKRSDLKRLCHPENILRCRDLNVYLPNNRPLIHTFDLSVQSGESIAITGASGAGKSCLLRTFAGLWPYASGDLELPAERCLFVPQKPYVPSGTLGQILAYPHSAKSQHTNRVDELLELTQLSHLTTELNNDRPWHHLLSGGETQRLNLVRLLLLRPSMLFLDEATSNLDADWAVRYYALLKKFNPDCTCISVAHQTDVLNLHDRLIRLEDQHF